MLFQKTNNKIKKLVRFNLSLQGAVIACRKISYETKSFFRINPLSFAAIAIAS